MPRDAMVEWEARLRRRRCATAVLHAKGRQTAPADLGGEREDMKNTAISIPTHNLNRFINSSSDNVGQGPEVLSIFPNFGPLCSVLLCTKLYLFADVILSL